ncbi:type II toxin-antitoxin system RelE/ParE family toxin [Flavivirga sp. 57AJ16]|uniref:type II toxin-antitoxin system RelE/ParE family toxin n=1 Tax=Flavivirga sp. 57AJ16 TaxID=3025307 RepID=UPI003082552E
MTQADKYFESFFEYFDIITERPFSFESMDYIRKGYRRCVCGVYSIYYKINENVVEIMAMAIVGRQDMSENL